MCFTHQNGPPTVSIASQSLFGKTKVIIPFGRGERQDCLNDCLNCLNWSLLRLRFDFWLVVYNIRFCRLAVHHGLTAVLYCELHIKVDFRVLQIIIQNDLRKQKWPIRAGGRAGARNGNSSPSHSWPVQRDGSRVRGSRVSVAGCCPPSRTDWPLLFSEVHLDVEFQQSEVHFDM